MMKKGNPRDRERPLLVTGSGRPSRPWLVLDSPAEIWPRPGDLLSASDLQGFRTRWTRKARPK